MLHYNFFHTQKDTFIIPNHDRHKVVKTQHWVVLTMYLINTDHLGNVRVSFAKDPVDHNIIKILEENHYYAFGLKHQNYNIEKLNFEEFPETGVEIVPAPAVANASYNYKYNGKELQEELGLNMYDYGARNYDASIGRFSTYDPLAEKTSEPYSYCYNNPVNVIDPTGMSGQDWIKRGSTMFFDPNVKSQADAGAYGSNAVHMPEGSTTTAADGSYQYTYHNDGTITNSDGSQADAANGFTTKGGTTVLGTDSMFGKAFSDFFKATNVSVFDAYRGKRDNPGYNSGEGKFDRIFRLMNSSHIENMRDLGSGFSAGGYGRAANTTSLFRAVSQAELADFNATGLLRMSSSGYETGKLFTTTAQNASQFGKWLSPWDNSAMTIMRAQVPNSIMKTTTSFTADGLPAVSVPANQLKGLQGVKALNYSPIPLH